MTLVPAIAETSPDRFCPGCGYDLRGIDSARCPECGLGTEQAISATSLIPWTHRKRIGRVRAYLKTLKMTIFRPSQVAAEVARPVSLDDALAFRRVTAAIVAVPFILAGLLVAMLSDLMPFRQAVSMPAEFAAEWIALPFLIAGVWFFFLTMAGVQTYWFHPGSIPVVRQNRAVAISYYATAPLALLPIALALLALLPLVDSWVERYGVFESLLIAMGIVAMLLIVGSLSWTAYVSLVMLRRTTHCGTARVLSLIFGLPIAWGLLACIFLVAVPGTCLFVALLVLSQR